MAEKYDPYEMLRDIVAMMDGLEKTEQRQIMAALAEKFGMKLMDKTTSSGGFKPYPKRKRSY